MILSAKRSFVRRKSGEPPRRAFARQKTGSADDPRIRRRGNLIEPAMSACGRYLACTMGAGAPRDQHRAEIARMSNQATTKSYFKFDIGKH
jgi:hypothetical protein